MRDEVFYTRGGWYYALLFGQICACRCMYCVPIKVRAWEGGVGWKFKKPKVRGRRVI